MDGHRLLVDGAADRRVSENTLKFTVGLMLVAFGTYGGGEGIGVEWSLGDWTMLVLTALYTFVAWGFVRYLRGDAAGGRRIVEVTS